MSKVLRRNHNEKVYQICSRIFIENRFKISRITIRSNIYFSKFLAVVTIEFYDRLSDDKEGERGTRVKIC